MITDLERSVAGRIEVRFGDRVESLFEDKRGQVIRVQADAVAEVLEALRVDAESPFDMLIDVTAVDWSKWHEDTGLAPPPERFSVYYIVYSLRTKSRLFLEAYVGEHQSVPTATGVYASADWAEREVYDMFGIRFSGHPDLRRILMSDDFEGYPLRKEFPTQGIDPQDFPQE
jgi:NADH-quinone oxidoreductase subunit C